MTEKTHLGRDLIKMLAPILGVEDVSGVRGINLYMRHDDVAWMEIDRIAKSGRKNTGLEAVKKTGGRERYSVTVERDDPASRFRRGRFGPNSRKGYNL